MLNGKLLEVMGDDATNEQAFAHANNVLNRGGRRTCTASDINTTPGRRSEVDFEGVKIVMSWQAAAQVEVLSGSRCRPGTRVRDHAHGPWHRPGCARQHQCGDFGLAA